MEDIQLCRILGIRCLCRLYLANGICIPFKWFRLATVTRCSHPRLRLNRHPHHSQRYRWSSSQHSIPNYCSRKFWILFILLLYCLKKYSGYVLVWNIYCYRRNFDSAMYSSYLASIFEYPEPTSRQRKYHHSRNGGIFRLVCIRYCSRLTSS